MIRGKKCPNCGKKTLSHPPKKEWNAWKDYSRAYCRSCGSKYKIKSKPTKHNSD
jgi:DNA-directed RNA polymerase subunit RPC12/RpoP